MVPLASSPRQQRRPSKGDFPLLFLVCVPVCVSGWGGEDTCASVCLSVPWLPTRTPRGEYLAGCPLPEGSRPHSCPRTRPPRLPPSLPPSPPAHGRLRICSIAARSPHGPRSTLDLPPPSACRCLDPLPELLSVEPREPGLTPLCPRTHCTLCVGSLPS